jgi:hypothetical protein
MLGKEVLCLDGFAVLDAAKVEDFIVGFQELHHQIPVALHIFHQQNFFYPPPCNVAS